MKIGYACVSTADQHLRMQEDALKAAGCKAIYHDVISGCKMQRAGLDEALKHAREDDTLVVWKLDRLGRSLPHLIEMIQLLHDKHVGFQSLQENIELTGEPTTHFRGLPVEGHDMAAKAKGLSQNAGPTDIHVNLVDSRHIAAYI